MNEALAEWLDATLPRDADYCDVADVCISLFCTVEPLPPHLRLSTWNKENLAEAFALLTRRRFDGEFGSRLWSHYGATVHRPTDVAHWLDVQGATLNLGREPDLARAAQLLARPNVTQPGDAADGGKPCDNSEMTSMSSLRATRSLTAAADLVYR
jgi:hypothetical protein